MQTLQIKIMKKIKNYVLIFLLASSSNLYSQRLEDENLNNLAIKNYLVTNLDSLVNITFTFKNLDKTTTPEYKNLRFNDKMEFKTFLNTTLRIIDERGETTFKTKDLNIYLIWATSNLCEIRAFGGYCYLRKSDILEYINLIN